MKISIDEFEKSHYWKTSFDVSDIAKSLKTHFGITYFDYCQAFDDNTCIIYFTDRNYVNYFLKHIEYKPPTSYLVPGKYLWQNTIPPNFLSVAAHDFQYVHGLTIIKRKIDHFEVVNFSAPVDCSQVLNLYLNHTNALEQFVDYFIERMGIDKIKPKARLLLPDRLTEVEILLTSYEETIQDFIKSIRKTSKTRKNSYQAKFNDQTVSLSGREVDCLALLSSGLPNKKIAQELNISFRTVEVYFSRLLEKTNLKNRVELLVAYKGCSGR